jgi:4-carboxymuconolactone decarboxylase
MRLRSLTYDELDDPAKQVWDSVVGGARGSRPGLLSPSGGLNGPFNVMLYSPTIGERYSALGEALRFHGDLPDRLRELAIVVVGAFWRSNFEWAVHRDLALESGVAPDILEALARGNAPTFADPPQAAVFAFSRALLETGQVPDDAYAGALAELGETGVVELTVLVGYYSLISFTLNAFRIPPPPNVEPEWP